MHKNHNSNLSRYGVIPLCLLKYFMLVQIYTDMYLDMHKKQHKYHACLSIFSKRNAATEMQLQSNIGELQCTRAICLASV